MCFPTANENKKETDISKVIKSDISQSKIPTNDSKYQASQSNVESCRTVLEQKAILQQKCKYKLKFL